MEENGCGWVVEGGVGGWRVRVGGGEWVEGGGIEGVCVCIGDGGGRWVGW